MSLIKTNRTRYFQTMFVTDFQTLLHSLPLPDTPGNSQFVHHELGDINIHMTELTPVRFRIVDTGDNWYTVFRVDCVENSAERTTFIFKLLNMVFKTEITAQELCNQLNLYCLNHYSQVAKLKIRSRFVYCSRFCKYFHSIFGMVQTGPHEYSGNYIKFNSILFPLLDTENFISPVLLQMSREYNQYVLYNLPEKICPKDDALITKRSRDLDQTDQTDMTEVKRQRQ